ncbi:MAG: hypothetical protein IJS60_00940 [Abditibacteriota bacterium]|nr:hypothetical protein [Abditibacteriota bacterium]
MSDIKHQDYVNLFKTLKYGYPMQSKVRTMLVKLSEYAVNKDWATKNYATSIAISSSSQAKKEENNYTVGEIQELWKNKDELSCKLQLFYLYTGIRFNEISKISEFHLNERYIITGSKTEAGINRVVPIHKDILKITEEVKQGVFNFSESKLRQIFSKHSFDHVPKNCRQSFSYYMLKNKVDIIAIKKIMGHKYKDVTLDVYTRLPKMDLIAAIDKLQFI